MSAVKIDASRAELRQAKLLMQAGIDSSLAGEEDAAMKFFVAAQRRFEQLRLTVDAAIAGGWIMGLKKHARPPQQHRAVRANALALD